MMKMVENRGVFLFYSFQIRFPWLLHQKLKLSDSHSGTLVHVWTK